MKFKWLFLFVIVLGSLQFNSCKSFKKTSEAKKTENELEAQKKKEERQAEKEYKKLLKSHYKHQTEQTKERMKETKKRSEYYNRHKKRSFFQRLFGGNKDCNKKETKSRKKTKSEKR